ncbi:MAG: hypothetical protein MUF36_04580 [Bacteroidales bacterium]|jgi:hypothetical protein|nr:hypothetical protein [Bacteroidales bacterium]
MKALNWIGWASAGIGFILMLLGIISGLISKKILPIQHAVNYFHMANSFFLVTIALFIVVNRCECNRKE